MGQGDVKLHTGTPKQTGMSAERIQHIKGLAESWVARGIHPSLVVLAARRGTIVLHEAFGRLGPEPDAPPLMPDTLFPLASITKPITATALMLLVEDGLVGLFRPVSEYIPEFVGEGKYAVKVHHLLTHTSGLREEDVNRHAEAKKKSFDFPPVDENQHPRIHERLWLGYDAPLWKPPGEEMSYCTFGYALLGEIVRRVSGRSLADCAEERIFRPLGMEDTCYTVPASLEPRIVRRAEGKPGAHLNTREAHETPAAGSGAYSTAMDMAVFGQMFLNGGVYGGTRILSPVSVAEMTRNQIPGISALWHAPWGDEFFPEAGWGLGWGISGNKKEALVSPKAFRHLGWGGVLLWVDPVYEIVGVFFSVDLMPEGVEPSQWCGDLFEGAVTAAVIDV
jgi:CubicO group peptidase (beta-lactamase class C family)